jgi:Spondin_N
VSITNLTRGQQFTPILAVTHRPTIALFALGQPASDPLRTLAEEGNTAPFVTALTGNAAVTRLLPGAGLTNPGTTARFTIEGDPWRDKLSVAAMLIPTNDNFVAVNSVDLPERGETVVFARSYDAGTELNDEKCASIPGPFFVECNGSGGGARIGGGEGYVYIGNGIHGIGDLKADLRDWRNPVAQVRIRRVR